MQDGTRDPKAANGSAQLDEGSHAMSGRTASNDSFSVTPLLAKVRRPAFGQVPCVVLPGGVPRAAAQVQCFFQQTSRSPGHQHPTLAVKREERAFMATLALVVSGSCH